LTENLAHAVRTPRTAANQCERLTSNDHMPMGYDSTEYEVSVTGSTRASEIIGGIAVNYAPGEVVCTEDPEETYGVSIEIICNSRAVNEPVNMKVLGEDELDNPCMKTI
jgi:hypothetical protein